MADQVLASIRASAPRRGLGVSVLMVLGVMVIYIAIVTPPGSFAAQALLIALGVASLWLAERMRRATALQLELTETELRSSDGTVLARTDQFVSIDRGAFAFKPSHGFMLKLSEKAPPGWQPGMYWRMGKRLGVGGVTPGAQTKMMSDMIAAMIMERHTTDQGRLKR